MGNSTFRWRVFVSFFLALTFFLSAVSGTVLFLRPEGSLAAWTGWSALGLDKKDWEALHAVSIFFFLLCAVVHLARNWSALRAYCRRRGGQGGGSGRFREFALALLLAGLLLAATLWRSPPLRWIVDLRSWFKSGAPVVAVAPPMADAQSKTLGEIGLLLGMDEAQLLERARRNGLQVKSTAQTLADVAERNGVSPEDVYRRLSGK